MDNLNSSTVRATGGKNEVILTQEDRALLTLALIRKEMVRAVSNISASKRAHQLAFTAWSRIEAAFPELKPVDWNELAAYPSSIYRLSPSAREAGSANADPLRPDGESQ